MSIDTLYWEITGACNLRCTHCHLGGPSKAKKVSAKESLDRIDIFAQNGIETLLLTGGEPLTNPNVYDMIKRATGHGMDVALLTNGTLIDKKRAKLLAEANPTTVQISIDGMPEYHDKIRGEGAFKKIEDAIDNLNEVNITPLMKLTITKDNFDNISEVVDYCASMGLRLNLSLAQELGNVNENDIMPTPEDYFRLFVNLYNRKKEEGLELTLPDFSFEEYLDTGIPRSGCSAGNKMATITKDDYFLPCVFMSGLGLGAEDGLKQFSEEEVQSPNKLFAIINNHNSIEFGCPLRKLQHCGKDPYSVYAFAEFCQNEIVQRES